MSSVMAARSVARALKLRIGSIRSSLSELAAALRGRNPRERAR
jgi:hypothetical protein